MSEPVFDGADEVYCPYCREPQSDSWEYGLKDDEETEITCGSCDKDFVVIASYYITYSTWKKEEDVR